MSSFIRSHLLRRTLKPLKWPPSRRHYGSPPPTYPSYDPVHVAPGILEKKSPLQSVLRWFIAGACIGLPAYWILWLGQKVSIPYYIGRLDSLQSRISDEQKKYLTRVLIEAAIEKVLPEIKESIGLPYNIETMPRTFKIKTPKIDPTRIIYRLDISKSGVSHSQMTFNPADISSLYVSKDPLPTSTDGEVGYKSLDDIRAGFILIEGMVKITGPKELGLRMGTMEFSGVMNVETGELKELRKVVLRVMGKKVE